MNKSLQKLMQVLKEVYNGSAIDYMKEFYRGERRKNFMQEGAATVFIGQLATWLTFTDEELSKLNLIVGEFNIISAIMESSNMSGRDVTTILSYVIEKNIKSGLLNDDLAIMPNEIDIPTLCGKVMNMKHIMGYSKDATYFESYIRLQKEKMAIENENPNTKQGIFDKEITNITALQESHKQYESAYLNKLNEYTREDIITICNALRKLEVSEGVINSVSKYLEDRLIKREKIASRLAPITTVEKPYVFKETKPINLRQIKKTYKELESYYNFFYQTPVRPLTYEEILYCLARLKQTDCSTLSMDEFVTRINEYNKVNAPLIYLKNILARLENQKQHLEEKENSNVSQLLNEIEVLKTYINEIELSKEEDKKEWISLAEDELPRALELLPKTI